MLNFGKDYVWDLRIREMSSRLTHCRLILLDVLTDR